MKYKKELKMQKKRNMEQSNNSLNKINSLPPYLCKVCGLGHIENSYSICSVCGWEDDDIQNDNPNYMGGANKMSLNQYKEFWKNNKELILSSSNTCFTAIDLAKKYFKEHIK